MSSVSSIYEAVKEHLFNRSNTHFTFPEGEIIFYKQERYRLGIYYIEFKEEFQNKGLFKSLMKTVIIEYPEIQEVWIYEPCKTFSVILMTSKFNGRYFTKRYCESYWLRSDLSPSERVYDHQKSEEIAKQLQPAKDLLVKGTYNKFETLVYSSEIYRHL